MPRDSKQASRRPFDDTPRTIPFWRTSMFQLQLRIGGFLVLAIAGMSIYLGSHPTNGPANDASQTVAQQAGAKDPDGHPLQSTEEAARTTPPTAAEQAERDRRLYSVFEGALADSANGDGLEHETPGYYKLLNIVASYTPEEVRQKAQRYLSYDAVLADPDGWRGEFVWARGVIAGLETVKLDTKAFTRSRVFRGAITDGDGSQGVLFDLPEHPGDDLSIQGNAYDIEGVFYRTATYTAKDGKHVTAPWLIVRNLRPIPSASDTRGAFLRTWGLWIIGAMAVAVVLWQVLVYVFDRRSRSAGPPQRREPQDIRAMFERRLREDGSPPPPPASP